MGTYSLVERNRKNGEGVEDVLHEDGEPTPTHTSTHLPGRKMVQNREAGNRTSPLGISPVDRSRRGAWGWVRNSLVDALELPMQILGGLFCYHRGNSLNTKALLVHSSLKKISCDYSEGLRGSFSHKAWRTLNSLLLLPPVKIFWPFALCPSIHLTPNLYLILKETQYCDS